MNKMKTGTSEIQDSAISRSESTVSTKCQKCLRDHAHGSCPAVPYSVLNLYAGLGGNRKHWNAKVTAVERQPDIAAAYTAQYPEDVGWRHYYDKTKHAAYMKSHREHKRKFT
jgi:hypothetical protein